jgi:hypothetical protein
VRPTRFDPATAPLRLTTASADHLTHFIFMYKYDIYSCYVIYLRYQSDYLIH